MVSAGREADRAALVAHLERLGYGAVDGEGELVEGTFLEEGATLGIHLREFPSPAGIEGGDRLRIRFEGRRIRSLDLAGRAVETARLEPELVASFYGDDLKERRPVALDELPEDLILCVLAAEDAGFLDHVGVSPLGILRAAWVNFREGQVRQGGSTLTQQLVKNLFLSPERRLVRKVREALLAVLLELRYEKRDILEAYLNEIYWGRSGAIDLMGVGAASWAWFGKSPARLELAESALLAGMIQAPARYSPVANPEAARARRDQVLDRLADLDWMSTTAIETARRTPIRARENHLVRRSAPWFADRAADEARRRFGAGELADQGFVLHSTLDADDQREAEEALGWGVGALEEGWEKGRERRSPLEAALVSVDPRTGSVLAWVGGRDYGASQFDRVQSALRQAGSAFKPVVYAAAFADRRAHPATHLDDTPLVVDLPRGSWSPENSDGKFHGVVTTREALERSLNVPTARLALQVGLERIAELAGEMGIEQHLDPWPALALGAMEVTPRELVRVYATLAAGGARPELHTLVAAFDRHGLRLRGPAPAPPKAVLEPGVAHLVSRVLQGVLDRGTARRVRRDGLEDPLAGKTGTTNDRRDSWFVGYSPRRATLVWVGYDDNSTTRLSGSRAALPIWTRFTWKTRPPGGDPDFVPPSEVIETWIDPETGGLATDRCPAPRREAFLADFVAEMCPNHDGWFSRPLDPNLEPSPAEQDDHPFRRWLRMLRDRGGGDRGEI